MTNRIKMAETRIADLVDRVDNLADLTNRLVNRAINEPFITPEQHMRIIGLELAVKAAPNVSGEYKFVELADEFVRYIMSGTDEVGEDVDEL